MGMGRPFGNAAENGVGGGSIGRGGNAVAGVVGLARVRPPHLLQRDEGVGNGDSALLGLLALRRGW